MISAQYGNWGTNFGYFYFGVEFVTLIVMFLIVPETGRLTLEQIDDFFEDGRGAWKTSLSENKEIAKGNTSAAAF